MNFHYTQARQHGQRQTPAAAPSVIVIEYNRGLREYRVVCPSILRGGDYYSPMLTVAEQWARNTYGAGVTLRYTRV